MTHTELAARHFAQQIDAEFARKGETVSDEELARWVRERLPAIPEHVAMDQVRKLRSPR